MPHSPEDKKRALSRVRRIRGQVEALERALESGEPCMTILQQIASIRGAANGLMGEMVDRDAASARPELLLKLPVLAASKSLRRSRKAGGTGGGGDWPPPVRSLRHE